MEKFSILVHRCHVNVPSVFDQHKALKFMPNTLKQLIKLKITGRCVVHEEEEGKSPGAGLNTFTRKVNKTALNMTSPRPQISGSFTGMLCRAHLQQI